MILRVLKNNHLLPHLKLSRISTPHFQRQDPCKEKRHFFLPGEPRNAPPSNAPRRAMPTSRPVAFWPSASPYPTSRIVSKVYPKPFHFRWIWSSPIKGHLLFWIFQTARSCSRQKRRT